jgi:hypothetical protein
MTWSHWPNTDDDGWVLPQLKQLHWIRDCVLYPRNVGVKDVAFLKRCTFGRIHTFTFNSALEESVHMAELRLYPKSMRYL